MPEREKVIKGLEFHKNRHCSIKEDDFCPYWSQEECGEALASDALGLLKEQESATVFIYDDYYQPTCKACGFKPFVGYIPTIKWMKERGYKYCPGCGKAVKFE